MGCWMIGAGELELIPVPDETLTMFTSCSEDSLTQR